MHNVKDYLQIFVADRRGAISIIAAFVLVGVVGVSALALEYGHALLQKVENQRVADLAAFGGALVYGSTASTTSATGAASNIAALNGVSSGVSPSVVSSPTGDGNNSVKVTVTTNVPLLLARVLTTNTTLPVSATSYAEIKSSAPACIIALNGAGTGVTMDGGTSVSAGNCAVASNNSLTLSGGAALVTQNVDYGKAAPKISGGATINPPTGKTLHTNKVTTADPLGPSSGSPGSTEVTNATARMSTVSSISSPSAPSVSAVSGGSSVGFGSSRITGSLPGGCTGALLSSVWTVACTGSGPYTFGTITHNGGVTVVFQTSSGITFNFAQSIPTGVGLGGSGSGTYNFNGGITTAGTTAFAPGTYNVVGSITTGGTATFGAGTYNVTAGVTVGGGSTTTFGAGTFNFGSASCSGTAGYSICNTGTSLTFGGPSTFILAGGIYNGGGASLTLGSGSTNSYNIGKASDGNSINVGTSKMMNLADASGSGDIFQTAGNITSGGGSCLALPAAAEHDVNGNIAASGGTYLGAGIYTINGYFALGASSGGDVGNCPATGATTGLNALGVTLVVSGANTVTCNGVASSAFCLGAGYSTVNLTAPNASSALGSSTANLAVIGPQSSTNTAAAAFTTGASNTQISGAFYFPDGPVTMSGAAALHDTADTNACLELIGSQVTLGGGSAAASTCAGLSSGSLGTTVTVVQ
jgi:Putative Flp pilus-assembly TadE/G-like